jgi:N-acetylglucosaminyldiphosphoundecaprenol N-acetyl-beta-D-mannosaminyltransferase
MIMLQEFKLFNQSLSSITKSKKLINTLNAHCFNMTLSDVYYKEALLNCEILLPDGESVVFALKWLTGQKLTKIAGADLFVYEMERVQHSGGKCFFLGSSESTLQKIKERAKKEYPNVQVQTYSPPYKAEFSNEDNAAMLVAINAFQPDVLMVGMTAPKQEKWAYQHYNQLQVGHICCIGAVFDFYAGIVNRAPQWMINLSLEWFYRLIREPQRMWRRYLIGNTKFLWYVIKEKYKIDLKSS